LKRSNRLVLLVGVFLAIVAFVGILVLTRTDNTTKVVPPPTTGPVVVATVDIPLSTRISADQVTTKTVDLTSMLPGAFTDTSQVVGQIVRQQVATGGQITSATLSGGTTGQITTIDCPLTLRCMALQVDQVSGVGTVIKTGDYVDMVVGLTADKFPVITVTPGDNSIAVVAGLNSTSVKLLLQGLQVMGTLLPPPPATTETTAPTPAPSGAPTSAPGTGGSGTNLNGQQQIVIVAVTAQQAEVLKFAQMDGNVTLALRAAGDFVDPVTGAPLPPVSAVTTGVTLKVLVDSYGVLPPEVVQTVTPTATKKP
jgi:Flp pilus assembly protein CpaB